MLAGRTAGLALAGGGVPGISYYIDISLARRGFMDTPGLAAGTHAGRAV